MLCFASDCGLRWKLAHSSSKTKSINSLRQVIYARATQLLQSYMCPYMCSVRNNSSALMCFYFLYYSVQITIIRSRFLYRNSRSVEQPQHVEHATIAAAAAHTRPHVHPVQWGVREGHRRPAEVCLYCEYAARRANRAFVHLLCAPLPLYVA